MTYLSPRFDNDIFLSYARVDNQPSGRNEGWVDVFKKSLEIEISKLIGRVGVIKIWMDTRQLAHNQYFDDEIRSQILGSGVFLALTSPGYLHPESYCIKELAQFYEQSKLAPGILRLGTRSRIFNALLYNIHHSQWPIEFQGIGGANLFDQSENESGYPSRITSDLFDSQVKELARGIHGFLSEYKANFGSANPMSPTNTRVFVADSVESLSELRSTIINTLQKEGVEISPRIPPPYPVREHDHLVAEELAKTDLSVHLFDATPGEKFMDRESDKTFLQRQAELALKQGKSQFIWVPPKPLVDIPTIQNASYRQFLNDLEDGDRQKECYTFSRDPANDVPAEILTRIKQLKSSSSSRVSSTAALLETHRKDQLHALDLYPLLLKRAIQPYINPEGDDPGTNYDALKSLVREISILIIIFGAVASEWVRERLNSSLQALGTEEPCRLKLCGIYAPPGTDGAERKVSLGHFPGSIPVFFFSDPATLTRLLDVVLGGEK